MVKSRIFLFVGAGLIVFLLFKLPRAVVDNDPNEIASENGVAEDSVSVSHNKVMTTKQLQKALTLSEKLRESGNIQKNAIFADSLAQLYLSVDKYDSAAKFIEIIAQNIPNAENLLRTGNAYYEAYGYTMDDFKRVKLAAKAREYFQKVLDLDPANYNAKNKLAMTYISTSNPMQGIMMLREVLQDDPQNEEAMFNLGVLSMQSGQYDKAVERFRTLISIYPENSQAQFFLGVSYLEVGNKGQAKEQFLLVKSMDEDPAVQATIDSYLNDIE